MAPCGNWCEETRPIKRPSIKLQNIDKSHNRYLTSTERDRLFFSKPAQIVKISSRRAKTETYRLLPPIEGKRDMNEASSPSITKKDMLVNAGVENGNRQYVRAKVKAHRGFRWSVKLLPKIDADGIIFTAPREA